MVYNEFMTIKKRDDTMFTVIGLIAGVLLFASLLFL